jgi:hypothetical protein
MQQVLAANPPTDVHNCLSEALLSLGQKADAWQRTGRKQKRQLRRQG